MAFALTKVTRNDYPLTGVGPSGPKREAPRTGDDIVCSVWRHTAVLKRTGEGVANLVEHKGLHNKPAFIKTIGRQYDSYFANSGAKIGQQLRIRLPLQFQTRWGLTASPQPQNETYEVLTVADVVGVDLDVNSIDLTMSIDDFGPRFLDPAMDQLTAALESKVLTKLYSDVYQFTGTAGVSPAAITPFTNARTKLNQSLAPKGQRYAQVDSPTSDSLVNALTNLFHPSKEIESQFLDGCMGHLAGADFFENELAPAHTNGTMTGSASAVVNGPGQMGATLNLSGWTAGATMTIGSVFTIAGCNKIHPEAKTNFGVAQQFVVAPTGTDAAPGAGYTPAVWQNNILVTQGFFTADANGLMTIGVSPGIITSGAYQNVSGSPTSGTALTFATGAANTSYIQNLVYQKDAFTFVTADLELPKNMEMSFKQEHDGISLAFVRGFDVVNRLYISRFDVLWGAMTTRAQLATRVTR